MKLPHSSADASRRDLSMCFLLRHCGCGPHPCDVSQRAPFEFDDPDITEKVQVAISKGGSANCITGRTFDDTTTAGRDTAASERKSNVTRSRKSAGSARLDLRVPQFDCGSSRDTRESFANASMVRISFHTGGVMNSPCIKRFSSPDVFRSIWGLAVEASSTTSTADFSTAPVSFEYHCDSTRHTWITSILRCLEETGFISRTQEELLSRSDISLWGGLLPPITERSFERSIVPDLNGKTNANFYLYRHHNGLVMVGLAPTHFILVEARKILKSSSGFTCSSDTMPTSCTPGIREKTVSEKRNELLRNTVRVSFEPTVLARGPSGKRKRGGVQLHPDMRIARIDVKSCRSVGGNVKEVEPMEACESTPEGGQLSTPCIETSSATLYGCISGTLLEVNSAIAYNPGLLLLPPEEGGWVLIAKPSKTQKPKRTD